MNAIARISLYFAEGSSDKEYHAEIIEVAGGNVVNFRYGRRGGALTAGTKTATPVDFKEAQRIYEKLVKEKTAKGYTPDESGAAYQGTPQANLKSDFVPQLLNPVSEHEALGLMFNSHWAAQEKMDGERRAAHAEIGTVAGMNRRGLIVPLPQSIADELQALADRYGALRVDGEIIGEVLHVFDLHMHQGERVHDRPWLERMRLAEGLLAGCRHIKPVPAAITTEQKRALWNQVLAAKGEGIVFKRLNGPVTAGRPNSGGDWLKFKFIESASCCVMAVNSGRRSVQIGVLEFNIRPDIDQAQHLIPVGNVTIPPNHDVPDAGDIVEVQYLYAYRGGSLYQPVYRGRRSDLSLSACNISQLKFKPEGEDEDA